jgi:hypothetical protein
VSFTEPTKPQRDHSHSEERKFQLSALTRPDTAVRPQWPHDLTSKTAHHQRGYLTHLTESSGKLNHRTSFLKIWWSALLCTGSSRATAESHAITEPKTHNGHQKILSLDRIVIQLTSSQHISHHTSTYIKFWLIPHATKCLPCAGDGYSQGTSQSRLLLQKLTVTQLVKKFPAFYGARRFTTVFTTARHWYLS